MKIKTSDPRVKRRLKTAVEFATRYLSATHPRPCAQSQIRKYVGEHELGNWLREQLLVVHDDHWNYQTGKCKTYLLNMDGVKHIESLIGSVAAKIESQEQQQLITGQFEYEDKADRLHNPLQHLRRNARTDLFKRYGYNYDFDIEAAAPNLLIQYARYLGLTKPTPAIDHYCHNRTAIRKEISLRTGIGEEQVKTIINGLFQGSYLNHYWNSQCYKELKGNHHLIDQLRNDQFIKSLRDDIKVMWTAIRPQLNKTGRLTGKDKSGVYRNLERTVLEVIVRYLKKKSVRHFLIHDGFLSDTMIDISELEIFVRSHTGYVIKFSWSSNDF